MATDLHKQQVRRQALIEPSADSRADHKCIIPELANEIKV
jgi:hypothetical protein